MPVDSERRFVAADQIEDVEPTATELFDAFAPTSPGPKITSNGGPHLGPVTFKGGRD